MCINKGRKMVINMSGLCLRSVGLQAREEVEPWELHEWLH